MRLINPRWFLIKVIMLIIVWTLPIWIALSFRTRLIGAGHPSVAIAVLVGGGIVNVGWGFFLVRYLGWSGTSKFLVPPSTPNPEVRLFYVQSHGKQCGPYPLDKIIQLASEGQFQWTDLAWYQEKWVPLSSLPGAKT